MLTDNADIAAKPVQRDTAPRTTTIRIVVATMEWRSLPGRGRKRIDEENDGEEKAQSVHAGMMRNIPKKKKKMSNLIAACIEYRVKRLGCAFRTSNCALSETERLLFAGGTKPKSSTAAD